MITRFRWYPALLACCAVLGSVPVTAAEYPDHPVRIVVGFSPGGGTDLIARLVASKLSEKWGQPVVVENRAGADGTIAANVVAQSPPDGYTLSLVPNTFTLPPRGYTLKYDPIKNFAPISNVASYPSILLANPSVPANSVKDLIALAKAKPGSLNYGSLGPNQVSTLMMDMLMQQTRTDMVAVSYQGGGAALVGILGNEIQLFFAPPASSLEHIKSGRLKALAVSTNVRSQFLPDVPTIAQAADLPTYNVGNWNALVAPAGTPRRIVDKIQQDVAAILSTPEVRKTFKDWGIDPDPSTPEKLAEMFKSELATWTALLKQISK